MAYDKAKAREYYQKYRKRGLKKGRKKGKKKTTKTQTVNLVGLSTSGLNESGVMQAALVKEKLKKEMNEALKNVTDQGERDAIRQEYQKRALDEITKMKSDANYAKPKAEKKAKEKKASAQKQTKAKATTTSKATSNVSTKSPVEQAEEAIETLRAKINTMTDDEKAELKKKLSDMIAKYMEMLGLKGKDNGQSVQGNRSDSEQPRGEDI